jgi:membrane associated rhomboid family serine protease
MVIDGWFGGRIMPNLFVTYPGFRLTSPLYYFQLIGHALGHRDWTHLFSNFSVILLVGPILEEKYGSGNLMKMMLITALITGLLNSALFTTGLVGASGLAFLMILLASFTNHREGELPMTFLLVLVLFLAREVVQAFSKDDISQFAHILGGVLGSLFGFFRGPKHSR